MHRTVNEAFVAVLRNMPSLYHHSMIVISSIPERSSVPDKFVHIVNNMAIFISSDIVLKNNSSF